MNSRPDGPLVYLLALEPSGDVLGAKLMAALVDETQGQVRFAGVGGDLMTQKGLQTLFDPSDLAILGLFEVLPKARLVFRRVREVLADVELVQPDILVTIDSWGFTGRVHKALTKRGSPLKRVRYVAPQVWAWRPGRAKQLAQWIDHLLTLFPFEPPFFEKYGLASTWVGHPVVELQTDQAIGEGLRAKYGISPDALVLAVLPGSRSSEVTTLCSVFGQTIQRVAQRYPNIEIVIPTVSGVEDKVRAWARGLDVPAHVIVQSDDRREAMRASRAALAASGTITLELAMAGVPHVIAYRVNPVSAFVFRRLAKTKYVNLINILLDRGVVPELLQQDCRAELLSEKVSALLTDEQVRQGQLDGFEAAVSQLSPSDVSPSVMAARVVLKVLKES